MKRYAGIGSRETPQVVLDLMTKIAVYLNDEGYVLRSGGADGADKAFESGAGELKEIFLPWKGFNGSNSLFYIDKSFYRATAYKMASQFHPAWDKLNYGAQKLMARNTYQVLGKDLKSPSEFIVCWTKGGKEIGGTAQAIRIAKHYEIKVYNLGLEKDLEFWKQKVE